MGTIIWLGGCMLGLLAIEWVQRVIFPGKTSGWLKVLGRTRCREGRLGGPDPWAALRLLSSGSPVAEVLNRPPFSLDFQNLSETERVLRGHLMETGDPLTRAGWLVLLAEVVSRTRNGDPIPLLDEASSVLWKSWSPSSEGFRSALAQVFRLKGTYLLREARLDDLRPLVGECDSLFGGEDWVKLLRAEIGLLLGNLEAVRSDLAAFLPDSPEKKPAALRSRAMMLIAESFLREHAYESLEWAMRSIDYREGAIEEADRLVYARLRIESALSQDRPEVAWRYLSVLHEAARKVPHHPGRARYYHLACARMHMEESSFAEAHRRLQLAENLSSYRVARWEVDVILAGLLEREERTDEAAPLWEKLEQDAAGTYFGDIARARLSRYRAENPRYQIQNLIRPPSWTLLKSTET